MGFERGQCIEKSETIPASSKSLLWKRVRIWRFIARLILEMK